jgi:hypothetical protein
MWPGVSNLREYRSLFPRWEAQDVSEVVPMLDAAGKDLLLVRVVHTNVYIVNICWSSGQVLGCPLPSFANLNPHLPGTKCPDQVVSTPSYLIIPSYVSRPRDQLSTLRFLVVFLNLSRYVPR